ncbi:hypothetical protein [Promicromonospora sp. NPDC023987]|uniref:hypothetical protein n=1 Tax=Promicromonospora sp. NPDC023987 TaxID=3155360 RepID=UPI0033F3C300
MNAQHQQDPFQQHVKHGTRQPAQPQQSPPAGPSPFAVHGDPSQHQDEAAHQDVAASRRLQWTRLADLYADPRVARLAVRGVDLHAHLLRAIRNAPLQAAKATRRHLATPKSEPARRPGAGPEGMELS